MKKIILILTILIITCSGLLAKSTRMHVINKKQKKQISKIEQGVKSGELTRTETKRLIKQEKQLQKQKRIAKSDGVVTHKERAKLRKEINKLDIVIYKQKHDKQKCI